MRIIYCIDSLSNCGGRERVTTVKANYLAEHGWDVSIIVYNQGDDKPYFALSPKVRVINLEVDYSDRGSHRWRFLARQAKKREHKEKLTAALKQLQPDIVVSTFCEEARLLPAIHDGSKKILEIHYNRYYLWQNTWMSDRRPIRLLSVIFQMVRDRQTAKQYDAFVCLTHRDAKSWGRMKNIHVVSNPVTISESRQADTSLKRVITAGRLTNQKRHDILIRCWAKVATDIRKGWTLDIYGNGEFQRQLEQQIADLGIQDSVRILAPVKNIAEEYQRSSIFALTSDFEGFPLVLCEAMSTGLPPVAIDCPCGPSDMIQDESMGMLIPMGREDLFVEKLQQLMSDAELRRRMGAAARHSINARYTVEVIMQEWTTLFHELGVTNK